MLSVVTAVYFVLETGCRPSEASYLVLCNSFKRSRANKDCDYKAVVPAHHTKTVAKYKWGVKRRANRAIELVKELHERAPTLSHLGNQHRLASLLHCWFTRRILKDAAKESPIVRDHLASDPMYNLRTVRARFGTEWALAKEQADKEGREAPPNPLQHKTPKTTYRCYVVLQDSETSDEDVLAVEDEPVPET